MLKKILEKIDNVKKEKALSKKGIGLYIDRQGRYWFDHNRYCRYGQYRKIM